MSLFAQSWATAAPAVASAFTASLVEIVEAFTIVLAVGTVRGWRVAWLGTAAALVVLGVIVVLLGPALAHAPLAPLRLTIGVLLLLFGLGWLRKAVLRAGGVLALRDENAAYARDTAALRAQAQAPHLDWIAGFTAFKAVLLEGIEVAFIVVAVGAGRDLLVPASIGAACACAVVLVVGAIVHRPLARVPENALKFAVGVMCLAFGVFWIGEGLGIAWPGEDAALLAFGALFLITGLGLARALRAGRLA